MTCIHTQYIRSTLQHAQRGADARISRTNARFAAESFWSTLHYCVPPINHPTPPSRRPLPRLPTCLPTSIDPLAQTPWPRGSSRGSPNQPSQLGTSEERNKNALHCTAQPCGACDRHARHTAVWRNPDRVPAASIDHRAARARRLNWVDWQQKSMTPIHISSRQGLLPCAVLGTPANHVPWHLRHVARNPEHLRDPQTTQPPHMAACIMLWCRADYFAASPRVLTVLAVQSCSQIHFGW